MGLTIVVMDKQEEFLTFLDEDLCTLEETIEYGGLRTLSFEYKFQDILEDKALFKIGNKIWVQGDNNLKDCLYVINTEVTQDIYDENCFKLDLEEVLVELNYAPVFSQTELDTAKEFLGWDENDQPLTGDPIFHLVTSNNNKEVVVDWNALNYWFGNYFNIGTVQKCISEYASRISITGTVNRMELLRNIEEETGNIFVTRYEKDVLTNTIHRYLDFLNPINCNKDWSLHLEYDFNNVANIPHCYDENGNIASEDNDWDVSEFENETIDENRTENPDSQEEQDIEVEDDYDVEVIEPYDSEANELFEEDAPIYFPPVKNLDPANCVFRIVNKQGQLLDTDGRIYLNNGDTPLQWDCPTTGLDETDYPPYLITIQRVGSEIGITCNEKSFCVAGLGEQAKSFLPEIRASEDGAIACDTELPCPIIPDDSYFEIYDHVAQATLYHTQLNIEIGHVHEEVLDFGFNLENIEFNVDETDTYTAISPLITLSDSSGDSKQLSRSDLDTIINRWLNLEVSKGQVVPMIVEKVNVTGTDLANAQSKLGAYSISNNYWIRPLKPNDNTDSTDKTFEFYRAIAYWKAPYTKHAGQLHVSTDKVLNTEYSEIYVRPDTRNDKMGIDSPKMGNTETTDEDIYAIYNQVALYLKEHETPTIELNLDVANLRGYEYNNYDLHDKIYIKLPNTNELVTSRITKTTKEAHDVAKNTVEISNYKNLNTVKTLTHHTHINAGSTSFTYPASKTLTAQLENDEPDSDTVQYPPIKLLTFSLYKVESGSRTFTGTTYTKLTQADGTATINMKYDPGDYEMDISFVGDEEYEESSITISINVGGTIPAPAPKKKTTTKKKKSKTTKKKKTKKKVVKEYWTKCGLSPDKKHTKIVSVAQPNGGGYNYNQLYKTVFKNHCPECGRDGYLRFDGGSKNKCISSSTYGHPWKDGVPEHEITCIKCDSDFCGVTGVEKDSGHSTKLKTLEKPKKSSQAEFNKLVKGKLLYSSKTVTVKTKQKENTKTRKIRKKDIASSIKKKALAIVGNSTGSAAMKKIVNWVDKKENMKYKGYYNFKDSPATCLKRGSANCCDGTRFFFELCDAAGLTEYYNFYYVHVQCPSYGHVYGIVETKKTKKWRYVDLASNYHGCWNYVCDSCPHGGRASKYPKLPF